MRLRFAIPAAALTLVGAAAAVPAFHATGPPVGHTGGFGEPTCLECHRGSDLNAFGGRVTVQGLPEVYGRGRRYQITVALEAEETATAGFQISARYAGGAEGGMRWTLRSRLLAFRAELGSKGRNARGEAQLKIRDHLRRARPNSIGAGLFQGRAHLAHSMQRERGCHALQ